ncbi:unnamed protein product [Tilletia laevis]|nr:hypothetical protein CF336_g5003 [Tilletia laevis]KAE8198071.1 hypothetical protein CF335_g4467 [Tilletia laevis]CAD6942516.1 unnamed protein product [Tilletia laevis]
MYCNTYVPMLATVTLLSGSCSKCKERHSYAQHQITPPTTPLDGWLTLLQPTRAAAAAAAGVRIIYTRQVRVEL